jgi:hypothetical protein
MHTYVCMHEWMNERSYLANHLVKRNFLQKLNFMEDLKFSQQKLGAAPENVIQKGSPWAVPMRWSLWGVPYKLSKVTHLESIPVGSMPEGEISNSIPLIMLLRGVPVRGCFWCAPEGIPGGSSKEVLKMGSPWRAPLEWFPLGSPTGVSSWGVP